MIPYCCTWDQAVLLDTAIKDAGLSWPFRIDFALHIKMGAWDKKLYTTEESFDLTLEYERWNTKPPTFIPCPTLAELMNMVPYVSMTIPIKEDILACFVTLLVSNIEDNASELKTFWEQKFK